MYIQTNNRILVPLTYFKDSAYDFSCTPLILGLILIGLILLAISIASLLNKEDTSEKSIVREKSPKKDDDTPTLDLYFRREPGNLLIFDRLDPTGSRLAVLFSERGHETIIINGVFHYKVPSTGGGPGGQRIIH